MAMLKLNMFSKRGQSLLEIMIALGVFSITISSAFLTFWGGQFVSVDDTNAQAGLDYAQEGLDAVRSIRDRDWKEVTDGDHGLVFLSGDWYLASTTSDSSGIFTRKVSVATVDANTKIATTTITWQADPLRTLDVTLVEQLTDWNSALNLGGDTGGSDLSGDWKNIRTIGSVDIGSSGQATDLDVFNKIIYLTAVASDPKKKDFFIINAINPSSPTIISSLDTGSGLNAVDAAGKYAYLANSDNNAQLQIVDISDPSNPVLKKSFKLSAVTGSGAIGQSIFFYGNKVYMGTKNANGPEFHIIDVSDPVNPAELGSKEIGSDINAIRVDRNFAYLSTADDPELRIFDVGDPAQITSVGNFEASGSQSGETLAIVSDKLYLGRVAGSNKEMHILNISNKNSIQNLGSLDLNGDLNTIIGRGNLVFLGTSDSNKEFQVWDISNPQNLSLWSSFNFPQVASGIDYEDNFVYVAVRSNDALRIITSSP